jgi:hypothetical protein
VFKRVDNRPSSIPIISQIRKIVKKKFAKFNPIPVPDGDSDEDEDGEGVERDDEVQPYSSPSVVDRKAKALSSAYEVEDRRPTIIAHAGAGQYLKQHKAQSLHSPTAADALPGMVSPVARGSVSFGGLPGFSAGGANQLSFLSPSDVNPTIMGVTVTPLPPLEPTQHLQPLPVVHQTPVEFAAVRVFVWWVVVGFAVLVL